MSKESGKDSKRTGDTLFRDAMKDVTPIKVSRPHRSSPPPRPRATRRRADDPDHLAEAHQPPTDDADVAPGEALSFRRPGLAERDFRKLRRGQWPVQDEADLHGLRADEAAEVLRDFIAESVARGRRCVRVVHGKGLSSGPRGPVLKNLVNRELRRWDAVLAFCTTQARHGGTGAVYVLLRRR